MEIYEFKNRVNTEEGVKYTYESLRFELELFLNTREVRKTSIPLMLIGDDNATVSRVYDDKEFKYLKRQLEIDE